MYNDAQKVRIRKMLIITITTATLCFVAFVQSAQTNFNDMHPTIGAAFILATYIWTIVYSNGVSMGQRMSLYFKATFLMCYLILFFVGIYSQFYESLIGLYILIPLAVIHMMGAKRWEMPHLLFSGCLGVGIAFAIPAPYSYFFVFILAFLL